MLCVVKLQQVQTIRFAHKNESSAYDDVSLYHPIKTTPLRPIVPRLLYWFLPMLNSSIQRWNCSISIVVSPIWWIFAPIFDILLVFLQGVVKEGSISGRGNSISSRATGMCSYYDLIWGANHKVTSKLSNKLDPLSFPYHKIIWKCRKKGH